jgi:hypothetical protein
VGTARGFEKECAGDVIAFAEGQAEGRAGGRVDFINEASHYWDFLLVWVVLLLNNIFSIN